jgi:hypothetical protein
MRSLSDRSASLVRPTHSRPPASLCKDDTSVAGALGRIHLLLIVPASAIWIPVTAVPGVGTIAACDLLQLSLWCLVLFCTLSSFRRRRLNTATVWLATLPFLIGLLAALASWDYSGRSDQAQFELALYAKKFGFAACVLPALAMFWTPAFAHPLRLMLLAVSVASAAVTLVPGALDLLPATQRLTEHSFQEGRVPGLFANPNDLAYVSVALATCYFALVRRPDTIRAFVEASIVLVSTAFNLILSGSRSGMAGAFVATGFVLLRHRIGFVPRVALVVLAMSATVAGLTYNEVFASRVERVYADGLRENNLAERITAQRAAVMTWFDHPLGVGSRHASEAIAPHLQSQMLFFGTADSVYIDTLLSSGVLGVSALLALFALAWHLIGRCPDKTRQLVLRAGLLAFLVFGTASVSPASASVAPSFFLMISMAQLRTRSTDVSTHE